MATDPVIRARNLTKRFGPATVVQGIDFEVRAGGCTGLLGPNGAGKTTTMRMVVGMTRISAGELTVLGTRVGRMPRGLRARIGMVPQDNNLDNDLTVLENLLVYGRYFGLGRREVALRAPRLLDFMQLGGRAGEKVMQLSGGMKRRLVIARALIGESDLVILDEPSTGLDPQARVLIWKQLLALRAAGKTLLLTTHYMDEAQRLCDRIVIIDHGRILDEGAPADLIARHARGHVLEVRKPLPAGLADGPWEVEDIGDSVLCYLETPASLVSRLPADAVYTQRVSNLEDVFLRLTGRRLRET